MVNLQEYKHAGWGISCKKVGPKGILQSSPTTCKGRMGSDRFLRLPHFNMPASWLRCLSPLHRCLFWLLCVNKFVTLHYIHSLQRMAAPVRPKRLRTSLASVTSRLLARDRFEPSTPHDWGQLLLLEAKRRSHSATIEGRSISWTETRQN